MGSRDYRHRETKKTKKGAKNLLAETIIPPVTVEIVKKGKKEREEEK